MKSKVSLLVLPVFFFCGTSLSQETTQVAAENAELQQTRALLESTREDIINEEMRFSDEEAAAFWPVYERYRAEQQELRDRFGELLVSYTNAYRSGTVTEALANQYVADYLDIQSSLLDIKKKFLPDFREALPARKAARFYQLENKMEIELEYQLSLIVPLVDPV